MFTLTIRPGLSRNGAFFSRIFFRIREGEKMVTSHPPAAVQKPFQAAFIQKSNFILGPLLLFTLSDIVLSLLGEAVKTHLIGYIRYTDMIDLVLIAPLYLLSFVWMEEQFVAAGASTWLRRAFLILAMLFLYGHAMHVTANAINTFSTEIHNYLSQIPADTYALLYFLDETLSHYIVFIARFGLFACLLLLDVSSRTPDNTVASYRWALALGCLYGVWQAIVFTEGQKVFLLPVLAIGLGALWYFLYRRQASQFSTYLRSGVMTAFVAGLIPFIFIGLLLYAQIVGGFIEPSKLGG
jgi:hypothetical protein